MRIAIEESIVAAIELGDTGAACAPVLIKTSQLRRICLSQEGVDAFAVHRAWP